MEIEYCPAWVGLEPPEFFDCYLPVGHQGSHKGVCMGTVRKDGDERFVKVFVEWFDPEWQ